MLYHPTYKAPIPEDAKRTKKDGVPWATWRTDRGRKVSAEVRTDNKGNEYVLIPTAVWHARYTDSVGRVIQRSTKCTDKAAAESVLNRWKQTTERVRAGIVRTDQEHVEKRGPVLIDAVLPAYMTALLKAGRTQKHVDHIAHVVEGFRNITSVVRVIDITQRTIEKYLHSLTDDNLSARTVNHHKALLHGFCAYCVRTGALESNPVAHIQSMNTAVDRRHVRRALTDEEVVSLLEAAASRPLDTAIKAYAGKDAVLKEETKAMLIMRGRERRLIYLTLLITGCRWGELRAATVADCKLDGPHPHIVLRATNTKNRKEDTVPLTRALADELRSWVRDSKRIGKATLFSMPDKGTHTFDLDLEKAGIPKTTDDGVMDIHALRHTCATRLARNGVSIAIAQRILRHSDPKITMAIYSHLGVLDTTEAVESLPDFSGCEQHSHTG